MDLLLNAISAESLARWEVLLNDWVLVIMVVFLIFELARYAVLKRLDRHLIGDTLTNFVTYGMFLVVLILLFYTFYISALFWFHQFALFDIGINWLTIGVCIVLADFAYYWEHRFSHRVALAWATHTVHHSSPHFNISVAIRFGPMDAFWPLLFHIPLVVAGFDPWLVIFSEAVVLLYQTALHTEVIGKLPRPIEAIFNTPSHHRVHHGRNPQYIDKNYAGMFIVWDRLFGTFAEEDEKVVYGITEPLNSVNPFVVFFHGLTRLWRSVSNAPGSGNKLATLLRPPGWRPASTANDWQTGDRGL